MDGDAIYLLILLFGAIALLITLISSRAKVHPFLALFIVSTLTALAAGIPIDEIPETMTEGAGSILGHSGVVIALGAMLGKLLADSGAVRRIADIVLEHSTPTTAPWLMTAVSFVIGIPMFFEVGLVVLMPVIYSVAVRLEKAHGRPKMWYMRILIPAIAALSCLHGMVPPHPGPLIAVESLGADVGLTILLGLICAVPTVILAGPLYAKFIVPRVPHEPNQSLIQQYAGTTPDESDAAEKARHGLDEQGRASHEVPTWLAFTTVLVPVALMLLHSVVRIVAPESDFEHVAETVGDPVVAMLLGLIFAAVALGYAARLSGDNIRRSFGASLGPIAGVIMILAGGGAFNEVLKNSGIGDAIMDLAQNFDMNLIMLGWLVGVLMSFATGSATVAIVSATGIIAPMISGQSPMYLSLVAIAIGSGSISLNWVNHAGFWFVKESFGMTIGQATKTHMMVQTLVSVFSLGFALLLSLAA